MDPWKPLGLDDNEDMISNLTHSSWDDIHSGSISSLLSRPSTVNTSSYSLDALDAYPLQTRSTDKPPPPPLLEADWNDQASRDAIGAERQQAFVQMSEPGFKRRSHLRVGEWLLNKQDRSSSPEPAHHLSTTHFDDLLGKKWKHQRKRSLLELPNEIVSNCLRYLESALILQFCLTSKEAFAVGERLMFKNVYISLESDQLRVLFTATTKLGQDGHKLGGHLRTLRVAVSEPFSPSIIKDETKLSTLLLIMHNAPNLCAVQLPDFAVVAQVVIRNGASAWWNQLTSVNLRGLDHQSDNLLAGQTRLQRVTLEYTQTVGLDLMHALEGSQGSLRELRVFQRRSFDPDQTHQDRGRLEPQSRVWPHLKTLKVEQMHFLHLSSAMPSVRRLFVLDVYAKLQTAVAPPSMGWPFIDFIYTTGIGLTNHASAQFPPPCRTMELDCSGAGHLERRRDAHQLATIVVLRTHPMRPEMANLMLKWDSTSRPLSAVVPFLLGLHPSLHYFGLHVVSTQDRETQVRYSHEITVSAEAMLSDLEYSDETTPEDPNIIATSRPWASGPVVSMDWHIKLLSRLLRWAPPTLEYIDLSPFTLPSGHQTGRSVWRILPSRTETSLHSYEVEMITEDEGRALRKSAGLVEVGYREISRVHEMDEGHE